MSATTTEHDRLISDKVVAELYEINRATVWRWVKQNLIPAPVVTRKHFTRWSHSDVQAAIAKMRQRETAEATS